MPPSKETGKLRRCSELLYEAYDCCQADDIENPTPALEEACKTAWKAYIKVRELLGDEVK